MASANRIGQINGEILRALSSLLPSLKDPRIQGLVSIVRVDTTNDLSLCRVYVSSMGGGDRKTLERGLQSASGYLRRELGRVLSLRHLPELEFIADGSIQEGARILGILNEITDS
ncbi:MAG: 30S ribosome-binding factor RbfA [Oscillospiraceae bacterium]|nr:30S ribosome-binding factor RbfA [Oscillospiraceae bacterium]